MRKGTQKTGGCAIAEAAFSGYQALKEEIVRRKGDLPRRLGQIAAFALDNPDEIAFGTVASISSDIHVPPSTIVRFAQYFGFDGFIELQRLFRERVRERSSEYEERLRSLDDVEQRSGDIGAILEGFIAAARQSVDKVALSVSREQFAAAVELLAEADTIYLVARRRSSPIVAYMAYAFGKLRVRAELVGSPLGIDDDIMQLAGPRDAAFAVSFSPYAAETVRQARELAARGVRIISLTDSAFSPLAEFSNVWFEVVETDYSGFRPLSASMALTMALAVAVAERKRRH